MTPETTDGAAATPGFMGAAATPEVKIPRPSDPYSTDWLLYNLQNPDKRRSVGAAADDDGGGDGDGGDDGGDGGGDGGDDGEGDGRKAGDHFSDAFADADVRKQAARYNTEEEMATALRAANVELSQRIKIPDAEADDATLAAYRKSIGVPDDIKGYDLQRPEFMEQTTYDSAEVQDGIQGIVGEMHKAGATKRVVDAAMTAYWSREEAIQAQLVKNDKEAEDAAEAALRKDWDKNYDANKAFAQQVADENPDLAQLELKDGSLVGSSPHFAKVLAELGRLKQEGTAQLGLINTEAGADLKTEHARLTSEIAIAHQKGDKTTAERLDKERNIIGEKLFGTGPITGQAM